jgi:hypothetical protein
MIDRLTDDDGNIRYTDINRIPAVSFQSSAVGIGTQSVVDQTGSGFLSSKLASDNHHAKASTGPPSSWRCPEMAFVVPADR